MFKKIFALATVLIALPALANAWTLGTWAKSQGGSITSPNIIGSQTVINGSVTKSYSSASENVTVSANPGWKISKLEINGIVQTTIPSMPIVASNGGVQKVYATFARQSYVLSSIVGANGSVDKSSYSPVYAGLQSPVKSFVFTPAPGTFVDSISATAGTEGVDYQFLNAVTGVPVTLPAAVGVKVKLNVANVPSTSMAFTASFGGTATGGTTPPTGCVNCHATQGVGGGRNADSVYVNWSSSANIVVKGAGTKAASCAVCHVGADTGAHPGTTSNNCIGCHSVAAPSHGGNVADNNFGVRAVVQEFSKWSHHVTGVNLSNAHCAACHLEGKVVNGVVVIDKTYHMADNMTHLRNADTDADMQWNPAAPNHSTMDNYCMSCHDANGATSAGSAAVQAYINTNGIAAAGKSASPSNPFGDTISNRYDKMQRPAVVNVDSQFNTTNNSHHAVKGPRYSGRTRTAGPRQIANPAAFAANSSATLWGKRSTIYDGVDAITGITGGPKEAFNALYVPLENAGGEAAPRTGAQSLGDDSTLHCGDCHTVGQYKPGTALGFTPTDPATIIPGTSPAIGAHGSNNEYLLRNSKGTDERHTQDAYVASAGIITLQNPNAAFLVCFNCHSYERYGSVFNATGTKGPHAGEYDASGRCNGVGNTIPFNGYTTGTATDGTQFESRIGEFSLAAGASTPAFAPGYPLNFANAPGGIQAATYTGEQNADFSNIFGIQCLNCHNSGVGNGYGGIHGSANNSPGTANTAAAGGYAVPDPSVTGGAYVDGMGNTNKVQRFLPGLGNVMYVPGTLGGFTGGTTFTTFNAGSNYNITTGAIASDTNWEQVAWTQVAGQPVTVTARAGAGCYTLNDEGTGSSLDKPNSAAYGLKGQSFDGGATIPDAAKTWGGCDDHTGASVGGGTYGFIKRINRPVTY